MVNGAKSIAISQYLILQIRKLPSPPPKKTVTKIWKAEQEDSISKN